MLPDVVHWVMLGHISLGIPDLEVARRFYDAVCLPLGAARVWTGEQGLGYGTPGREQLNLFLQAPGSVVLPVGFHLAFDAPGRHAVHAWYDAALANGGTCNGPPGPRPRYGPDYYAAFVLDPFGHHLEAKARVREGDPSK